MTHYRHGLDIIAGIADGRSILIRVDNAAELAERSSSLAGLALSLAPDTVEAMVYDEIAAQVASALRAKGAKGDVRVVDAAKQTKSDASSGFFRDGVRDLTIAVLGGIGAGLGLWWITRKRA